MLVGLEDSKMGKVVVLSAIVCVAIVDISMVKMVCFVF